MRLAAVSTKIIWVPVRNWPPSITDPTIFAVALAFVPEANPDLPLPEPASGDFHPATWMTGGPWYVEGLLEQRVMALVGPTGGGIALAKNIYIVWTEIDAGSEKIRDPAPGRLVIF